MENLNLSNFNTYLASNVSYMFDSCTNLKSLDLRQFNTKNCKDYTNIFNDCTQLHILINENYCSNLIQDIPNYVVVEYIS